MIRRIVISTYPDRAKAINARRNPAVSVLVHSDEWDGPYVQVDGTAEVLDMPAREAEDGLVEYFRCIAASTRTGASTARPCAAGQVADPGHSRPLGSHRDRRVPAGPRAGRLRRRPWRRRTATPIMRGTT